MYRILNINKQLLYNLPLYLIRNICDVTAFCQIVAFASSVTTIRTVEKSATV